ncbi:unnamed protein product [Cochlearia groenlandica]
MEDEPEFSLVLREDSEHEISPPKPGEKGKKSDDSDDDEDKVERLEYEVDETVKEFVDENMRERNQIPESSDEEDNDDEDAFMPKPRYKHDTIYKLALGT